MSLYVQCHESWVTSGFHQLSCRWQNEYLKVFGASKAEGRENISWLKGRKLFFQKLLKFTFFFFSHLVGYQLCKMYLHIFFGLPAFLLLRWNSGEVYAPALVALLRPHQGNPVVLLSQQRPERVQTTLNWRVPLRLRSLVCGFGPRRSRSDRFLHFFGNLHHSVLGFL